MKIDFDARPGTVLISAYSQAALHIGDRHYASPVVVTPERVVDDILPAAFEAFSATTLESLLEMDVDIILIGTGSTQDFCDGQLVQSANRRGVGIECMTSAAACRSYNVLASEQRAVAAALFPPFA